MAAPSSTVPVAGTATGPSPTKNDKDFLMYVQEFAAATALVLQEVPAEVLPVVGTLCKTLLALEQLVETARSNKEALSTLRNLCDVVIKGFLAPRTGHPWLPREGFEELQKHVERVEKVSRMCKGSVQRRLLSRKISNDIVAIRSDILAFCSVNNLVLCDGAHAKIDRLATDLDAKLDIMKQLTVTQAEYEAMEKELEKEVEAKDILEAELRSSRRGSAVRETELEAALADAKETLVAMKAELGILAAMKSKIEEERTAADLASRVKVPSEAPRVRDWFIEREAIVSQACDRLGIGSSTFDSCSGEPRMVGLAGPSGAGKTTVASIVIRREHVRAFFHKGVIWLRVGQGAKDRLAELMNCLAGMVYETVLLKACRPPRKACTDTDPEDGVAYIREVVEESSPRFLVVADNVWEVEVLEELKRAGVWVLYTTRADRLVPEAPPLRLDEVLEKEAELVLRRAAELDDDARLPEAAYILMSRTGFVVMDLALVGRWSVVRGRNDERAWQRVLNRILEAQKEVEGAEILSWRAAVLRAGLEELACDHAQNKELYIAFAVIPKGLAFPPAVAAVLLCDGGDLSAGDLEAAAGIAVTLERWSILTLEDGGKYRVHDQHAEFIRGIFTSNQNIRGRALLRWREYISSVEALLSFDGFSLVEIWELFAQLSGENIPSQPYEAALAAMDPLNTDSPAALQAAAHFSFGRKDWLEAYSKNAQLLEIQENTIGVDHLDVASTLVWLGTCASRAGRTEKAEEVLRRALTIQENIDHPDVASTLSRLGRCAYRAGRTEEAEGLFRRVLTIREAKLDPDHLDVASALHNLGSCASEAGRNEAGRNEEAEKFYRRALTIRERKLGVDHPAVASTLHNLGTCALEAGRNEMAEKFYRRALTIRERKQGVDHPDVACTLYYLGGCAYAAGRTEEAEELLRRALTIQKDKLGVDHQDVAETRRGLELAVSRKIWRTCQVS